LTVAAAVPARPRLCALLTCFNRREKTLACLAALQVNAERAAVELSAVLVDDASTDGTAAAVRERFPWVQVVVAEGNLYWCRGMHRAYAAALPQGHSYYLWLNDDTTLMPDALSRLLACHSQLQMQTPQPVIVVGSTRDSLGRRTTYGGERRRHWWPTTFGKVVPPATEPMRVDTFDGNIVLLSRAAAIQVGNLDPHFEHAMGDIDYGLRANRAKVSTWVAPAWHGVCDDNPVEGTYLDTTLPWRRRWALMLGRKGLPVRSWMHFNRQHSGALWPATFAWPYLRMLAQRVGLGRPPGAA
jgi:GT2 family glycosyltransferase